MLLGNICANTIAMPMQPTQLGSVASQGNTARTLLSYTGSTQLHVLSVRPSTSLPSRQTLNTATPFCAYKNM